MNFKDYNKCIQDQFQKMAGTSLLFRSEVSGETLANLYINSFSKEDDPIFRDENSTSHTCRNDRNFLRRYGNIVTIIGGKIVTMFDFDCQNTPYHNSNTAMRNALVNSKIENIFKEVFSELNLLNYEKTNKNMTQFQLGNSPSRVMYTVEDAQAHGNRVIAGQPYEFFHFNVSLPKVYVDYSGSSIDTIMANYRDSKNVFQRGMQEIATETLELVIDLINQRSILNGESYLSKAEKFLQLKKEYEQIPDSQKDNWCWVNSVDLPFAKFRNELIGTLCVDIVKDGLEDAILAWNKRADPANYMKAVAPITANQIKEAEDFVVDNGYVDSFAREFANISDINVSDIIHINGDNKKKAGLFDDLPTTTKNTTPKLDGVEEITIDKFMQTILPNATSIAVLFENRLQNNLVAITKPATEDSKSIFKWGNNFGWTYSNNLTGKSEIKEQVKLAGGNVDGIIRASVIWNDSGTDNSDLDLWAEQPGGQKIGFNTGFRRDNGNQFSICKGQLDLDNTGPGTKIGVENIYFVDPKALKNGTYRFWVNQYSDRGSKGFRAEIEMNGEIYSYSYDRKVSGNVQVGEVTYKDGVFSIDHKLTPTTINKEVWGIKSGEFHKANLVCLSPNHWGKDSVGNKHYFFMLANCHPDEKLRGFHTEFLNSDLLQVRKVMEVLGSKRMITPSGSDLAGLGFNATVKDSVVVRVQGTHNRMLKINF